MIWVFIKKIILLRNKYFQKVLLIWSEELSCTPQSSVWSRVKGQPGECAYKRAIIEKMMLKTRPTICKIWRSVRCSSSWYVDSLTISRITLTNDTETAWEAFKMSILVFVGHLTHLLHFYIYTAVEQNHVKFLVYRVFSSIVFPQEKIQYNQKCSWNSGFKWLHEKQIHTR